MNRKGRAGLNQYNKGVSHSSRMSRAVHDLSQASALNDTLQIPQTHLVDNHLLPKKTVDASQYMLERYGMLWADNESKTRRLLELTMARSQSSREEFAELDSKMKELVNKINRYTASSLDQTDASKQACCLLERVIEMKTDFYERLNSACNQLNALSDTHDSTLQALKSEKQRTESLNKEIVQLRADYNSCRDANIAQAASLTDTQMQLLEMSSVLENTKKSAIALNTENIQLKDSLQATTNDLTAAKNMHRNQIESFEALVKRSTTREQALIKELSELQAAYIDEQDVYTARLEHIHQLITEVKSVREQAAKQRGHVRRYKIRMGQLRRVAQELKKAVQESTATAAHNADILKQRDAQIIVLLKKLEEYKARTKRASSYERKLASQRGEIERLSTCVSALEQDLDRYKSKKLRLSAPPKVMNASKDGKLVQLSVSDDVPRSEGFFASTRSHCAVM